ncbi:uncharacterized protein [Battus philenor]|uniref:uncharacterized protein n=1 Tax=Battus philenor TaxID=42288 RepID=UPI0035CFCD5D
MQGHTASRRKVDRDKTKTDQSITSRRTDEEQPKRMVTTPRNYMQKSSTADIYGLKKSITPQAPKKTPVSSNTRSNVSPMKSYLKSTSQSSTSVSSVSSTKTDRRQDVKTQLSRSSHVSKARSSSNVKLNSQMENRKLNANVSEKNIDNKIKNLTQLTTTHSIEGSSKSDMFLRQRSKTRTLDEDEVKVFTPEAVHNNVQMKNLSKQLSATPKSFFVDLQDDTKNEKEKSSEEDLSYEDDFESYESDFDSYQSECQSGTSTDQEKSTEENVELESVTVSNKIEERSVKENEEKMLDSGSYDLRDPQRSAQKGKPLDFILEGTEEGDKKTSLTDEGFQEMSTSSGVSSMKVHVDVLDRPLFIDFTVSKRNRRKRRIFQQLENRAREILSMVTLHEMTYMLFEMNPIPYDLYMATFGRSNYTQVSVQTFEDGVSVEIQTDDIINANKWTQFPVDFSNHDVHINHEIVRKIDDDFLKRFTVLVDQGVDHIENNDEEYNNNPLRIYLEQKDGVGCDKILPKEAYETKLKQSQFNVNRLKKFLKKVENRISSILSINSGNTDMCDLKKNTKFPFSKGYVTIPTKNIKTSLVRNLKVTNVIFSESKCNLIVTVHEKSSVLIKCFLCLWDMNALQESLRILVATDDVTIGRFRGGYDGIVIAALNDGTIHLWDLSEEATWIQDDTINEKPTNLVEFVTERLTQTELDREWNLKNSHMGFEKTEHCPMHSSAYTSSGISVANGDVYDCITGLEFTGDSRANASQDGGRRVIAQMCSLQRIGILTLWSIIQQKDKTRSDIGKAFWSKLAMEKFQTIHLTDYLDNHIKNATDRCEKFNLNAAKTRITNRRKAGKSRQNSRVKSSDMKTRVASANNIKMLPVHSENIWENGIVCNDLRVMRLEYSDNYIIAKNLGEILCCKKRAGVFEVNRICVVNDASSIVGLEITKNCLPYVLAATESGTLNICSIYDSRVLLTLDCGKGQMWSAYPGFSSEPRELDKQAIRNSNIPDDAGAFFDALAKAAERERERTSELLIRKRPGYQRVLYRAFLQLTYHGLGDGVRALVTSQNEVQVHRLSNDKQEKNSLELFQKYISLL